MGRVLFLGVYTALVILIIELLTPNMSTVVKVATAGIVGLIGGLFAIKFFPEENKK
ncbi:hypothetical protein [Lentibacillus salicampi]|uniref:hypothetical protein n=1 Tax=Lentibacillus salicampi TaxID=175306 RepID=UPI0014316DF7|nr:hypothetical protein [Lentibacillus salicampi]